MDSPIEVATQFVAAKPKFPCDPAGIPAERAAVAGQIIALLEEQLQIWLSFVPQLPGSAFLEVPTESNAFKVPKFEAELLELATRHGKLEADQKREARREGTIRVRSLAFPGMFHVWRISRLLQTGSCVINGIYVSALASALQPVLIEIPRVWVDARRRAISARNGLRSFYDAGVLAADMLIGIPHWDYLQDVLGRLQQAAKDYQLAMLRPDPAVDELISVLSALETNDAEFDLIMKRLTNNAAVNKWKIAESNGQFIDSTVRNSPELSRKLQELFETFEESWDQQLQGTQERAVKELGIGLAARRTKETEQLLVDTLQDRKLDAWCNYIMDSATQLGGLAVAERLTALLRTRNTLTKVVIEMARQRRTAISAFEAKLKAEHPFRARMPQWVHKHTERFTEDYDRLHKDRWELAEEKVLQFPEQERYLASRVIEFERKLSPGIEAELKKERTPSREIQFNRRIWRPKNWQIAGSPGSHYAMKYYISKVQTSEWFWRWRILAQRIRKNWKNAVFWQFVSLVYGPVGLRGLFGLRPFTPNREVDRNTGELVVDRRTVVPTLVSRLNSLWNNVLRARRAFEEQPDHGLIPKGLTRLFNRVWNYVVKGAIGSTLIITVMPVLALINIVVCVCGMVLSPLWVPALSLVGLLFDLLVWDTAHWHRHRQNPFPIFRIVGYMLFGVFQIGAAIVATTTLPIFAVIRIAFATLRAALWHLWDFVTFHMVLRPRARVPASDSFLARRIAGPGVSSTYYYQITVDQVLVILRAKLEILELDAWESATRALTRQPMEKLEKFGQEVFAPAGGQLDTNHEFYAEVARTLQEHDQQLWQVLGDRRGPLNDFLYSIPSRDLIRLTHADLSRVLQEGTQLVQRVVPQRVLPYWKQEGRNEREFWREHGSAQGNYAALTQQLLSDMFSPEFMIALEESDEVFSLEVEHMRMSRYVRDLASDSTIKDDLETVSVARAALPLARCNPLVPFESDPLTQNRSAICDFVVPPHPIHDLVRPLVAKAAEARSKAKALPAQ
eukprot:TRINITY_DN15721_c0_g1_i1.p1 TRINITY_DN15721_c0_g1~~TRINITY_DN15721_c0_g1_i1.p1  ORF type:complete len:1018 (+),score=174.45 TRINITY_DN15721_c0_g1_i1:426-3479(+)